MRRVPYKTAYYICLIIYMLILGYALYDNASKGYTHSLSMCFVSLALAFVAPAIFKLCKWEAVYEIYIIALIFMLLASLLGSAYRFYDHVAYWDKYVHGFSGVLGALLGYLLYCVLKKVKKVEKTELSIVLLFSNAINITIAACWELFEYAGLVLFDYDGIRHYTTGVHDSMTDIIVCIIGGFITTCFIYHYYRSGKSNILVGIYETFYEKNKGK